MRLSMKKQKTTRKSRMAVRPPENKISIPQAQSVVSNQEPLEEISSFYINDMIKAERLDNAIVCVFSAKNKEISFEQDGTSKLKIKLHDNKSGHPLSRSFTFKEIEKMFKDYISKKTKAGE